MTPFIRSAIAAASFALMATGAAQSATITADYSRGAGQKIDITRSSQGSISNVFAGNFVLDPITGDDIVTFCIDLAHRIGNGVTYQMKSLAETGFSATVQSNINRLYSTYYDTLGGNEYRTAGFQVALWEIIDERPVNPFDLDAGRFRISDGRVKRRAQEMLNGLGAETSLWAFTYYDADGNQDQLAARPNPPGGAVPLPAGLPLLLTAMGGLAMVRRARKRA